MNTAAPCRFLYAIHIDNEFDELQSTALVLPQADHLKATFKNNFGVLVGNRRARQVQVAGKLRMIS